MALSETLKSIYYTKSIDEFSTIVEGMKRKAKKGLLETSLDEIDVVVQNIFAEDQAYQLLEAEADEAIEKFGHMMIE